MAVFVFRDGRMVDKATGLPMNPEPLQGAFPCPRVIADIPAYRSPVTGEVISGRRAKRDDLARHNCVDTAELGPSGTLGGKLRNRRFAEKRGLTHLLAEDAK